MSLLHIKDLHLGFKTLAGHVDVRTVSTLISPLVKKWHSLVKAALENR